MVVLNDFAHDSRVLREARALAEEGFEVFVIALYEKHLKKEEVIDGFKVIRLSLTSRRLLETTGIRVVRCVEFVLRSFWLIRKIQPAFCHCNDFSTLPIGYLSKKFLKSFLIYDSHELESHQPPGERRDSKWLCWLIRRLEHFLIKRADKVITVSDGIADCLARQDGIERPLVIRNISEFSISETEPSGGNHFGFNRDYKVVIYQGGLHAFRGIKNVIRAMKFLDKNIVLVLIGDGSVRGDLEREVAELDLKNRVKFTGWVSSQSLLALTQQSDLGLVPTENICLGYYYSLPNKIFEYIAAGIPLAVSNLPELEKIIKEYKIGETFNPADPKDIARAIQFVLQDRSHYQVLKKNVVEARKILNWDKEKQKLLDLYKNLESKK